MVKLPGHYDKKVSGRELTAFHEAGHCVAAVVLGLHFLRLGVSVVEDAEDLGNTFVLPPANYDRKGALKFATYLLCGGMAERHALGNDKHKAFGAHKDVEQAIKTLNIFTNDEMNFTMRKRSYNSAHKLVAKNWRAVVAVASELMKRNCLTGKQVQVIVRRALKNTKSVTT